MAQNVYTQKWEAAVAEVKNSKSSGQSSGSKNTYQSAWESAISELLNYGSDGYKSLSQQRKEQEMQRRNRTTPGKEIIDQFLSDANLFYGDAERAIENSTWTDAVNSFASRKEQADALKKSALAVSETLNANMDYYDPGYYDSMMEYLSNFDSNVDNTLLSLEDYFGQWDSEDSYQKHLNYLANEEAKRTLDVSAAEKELAEMQAARDDYAHNHEFDWTSAVERNAYDLYLQDLDKQISDKRQFTNQAKRLQEGIDLASVTGNEDFADKSGYVSTYADNPLDSLLSQFNMGYNDLTYEYINNQNGIRDEISRLAKGHGYTRNTTEGNYEYMTPEEVAIYNYHYATGGKEKAQQYLDNIQESLNYRKANELVEDLSGKTTQQYKFAATAGLDQFKQGIRNFLNTDDDYLNYSAYQIASQKVREDLADNGIKLPDALGGASLGQVAYDIINTGANMAPAMLAGLATGMINPTLGKLTGSALMGMNAGGGALQEALNEGYAREQARKYAVESGIAEAGMEYLLGGIGAFSNGIVGVDDAIKAVSNPVGRFALNLGKGMGSEAFEEGLQEYISPKIKNKNLYTEEKASASDIAYASILGGLTGGVMDLPGSVSSSFSRRTPSGSSSSSSADVSSDSAPNIKAKVSEDGNAKKISTNENVVVLDFASVDHNNATIQLKDGETVPYSDVSFASEAEANRFYTVASLPGIETEAANNLLHTIEEANVGGDIDSVTGIREAYGMGYYGMQESDLAKGSDSSRLAPDLRKAVFDIGRQQRNADALAKPTATAVTAKPAEGYKKVVFEGNVSRTVKKNAAEIRFVDYIADNFSGNTVHIYESFRGRDGKYYYRDSNGELHRAPNGRYVNGEIWLDTKAGDNGEGLMLNTFSHEMYHHIEKYNKAKAQELAEFVAKELGMESVEKAVAEQIKKARKAGLGESYFKSNFGMSEEQARNEVYNRAMSDFVADSLETMFTRGDPAKAIANLKQENRTLFDEIKAFIDKWVRKLKKYYRDKTISKEGEMVAQLENFEKLQQLFMEAMQGAGENYRAALEEVVTENAKPMDTDAIHTDGAFVTDGEGTMYSIRSMKSDIADGQMFEDLMTYCGWTQSQVDTLRNQLKDLVEYMTPYRNILDLNETYGREGRRFSPYKPNSDPLYKISMDFSTLCSKRLLTQYVIENLQLRENRPMSAEEQMAIRDMLNEYRKQEKGLQVACAMCYVEAARLKSPKQMQKWMDDPENYMRNYFADKDPDFAAYIKGKQEDFKESRGYARNAPKKDMASKDVTELNKIRPRLRSEYKPTAEEQAIIDKAKSLPNSTYLTAANLANLSESNPTIYAAYTSFVRTATRSKSLETDEPYYYGDSTRDNGNGVIVTDSFIEEVNRENGMRFSSWSDWRIQHMLDYITAVIDNSVRGAAMHGYTKFPEEVRVLGKTGMMFNMSGVAGTQTGLNEDGSLSFSETESIDVNEAIQLREEFPEYAGLQCIGVSDAHIIALMESDIIDYVIPYHTSGLNKGLRTMANIHGWKDYQLKQHASIDKDAKLADAVDKDHWHEEPVFSEFFVGYDTGMSGIDAMRASADRYKQMCADRGLKPKFEQFANEPNYWKLLIDRKMINQKTGDLIRQKPVSPIFDFDAIKAVVDRHVANYDSNMESRALNHIVENWDSIPKRIRDLKKSKKPVKKSVDNLSNQALAAQPVESMFSLRGVNKDGIEVYETREDVKNLTRKERQQRFLNIMANEYRGRTAKFIRNGHAYYATFDDNDVNKNIYGDKRSDKKGYRAKINVGADGDIFELVEQAEYDGSKPEKGKKITSHNGVGYWDYFIKTVQVDNVVFNLIANVRKKTDGAFVYSIQLNENKKIKASPPLGLLSKASNGVTNASGDMVTQPDSVVNTEMNSLRNEDNSPRAILSRIDPNSRKLKGEQQHLGFYQERLKKLAIAEDRLNEVNAKINSLPESSKREIQKLQIEARNWKHNIDVLNRDINRAERSDMFKKIVAEERKKFSDTALRDYKKEQWENIRSMQAENRAIREELTGTQSVMTIMEDEFVRLAKDLEAKKIDLKTMQEMFLNQSKQYDKDTQKWLREYRNLMSRYRKLDARNDRNLSKIEQLEEIIQRQRKTAKAKVTSRRNTELRHKIQRKTNELNQLLIHGTKHRNVPEYLQPVVADILDAINMEVRDGDQRRANYEATLARYDRQIAMTNNPAEVSRLIEKRNEYAAKGDQFANKMAELQKAYERIQKDKIPNMDIDEGLSARLMELFVVVGDTPLGQMTSEQLDAVNDVLNITKATISNANKLFQEGQRKGIDEISKSTMREVRSVGGGAHKTTDTLDFVSKFGWNNLKPVYAFEAIGSNTLTGLFNNLRKGEDTLAMDLQEAKTFFQTQWIKHHGKDWDMEKKWKFTSTSGKSFELDLNQIMSLYALSKREQAREHLRVGGFSFDSQYKRRDEIKVGPIKIKADVKTTDASAYNLTDETLGEIIGKLTADQRKFVDAMQTYLSDTMAAKGNEVSLQKYGIRLFKEQNYFPLLVADQYMAKVREQQTGDRKLKNAGFTQSVTPHAKNPVVLSSFTEVWAEHVDEMSLYHSFVLPLDDLVRVMNYKDMFTEETAAGSVVEAIRNAYGEGATQYIDQLIRDVNGGARTDSVASIINKWMGRAKKAQTMASLSVAIQQPSSILRAGAMIDGKYFLGPKVTEKTHDRTWNEIKQYAPIAIIKEMGGFDVNVGKSTVDYLTDTADYKGFGEKFKAMFTDEQFRDDVFGRLPALMDEMSWGVIWNAVKREQAELHPNVNGDAFMKLVANRFTDVIVHTQVYDSVFSRSGMMRSKDTGAKMMTSFMAEPTTTINMLFNTILQSKRGKINKAQVAKTAGAIVASLALNSALQSIVYAMRDDDEDKRYDEKWIENFYENFFNSLNPLGYIPFLRDVQNAFRGYDAERSDITLFAELMNAVQGLSSDELSAWDKVEGVLGSVGNLMGIPLKNILRDGRGIAKTIAISLDRDDPATKTGRQMARKTGLQSAAKGLIPWVNVETYNDGEEMLLAIQKGDEKHIQRVFGRFENQQKAESALQSAIRKKYFAGDLSAEEAEDLLTTNFDRDDEHEVYWLLEKWDYAKENGSEDGYVKYGNLYEIIDSGEDYASEITRLMEHGADVSTIRSQISKKYRKEYLADETVREQIREKLRPVYETTGMYESEIDEKFNDWDFEAEYGMTYSEFKTEYKTGNATEAEMRQAMKFYGKLNYEIEEGIRSLNKEKKFEDKYGMPLSDMKDAYDNGDITRNELINALVFNGATKSEARDEVAQRDVTNKYGIDYMKLDDAYKYGDISRQTFYQSMLDSGATRDEANEAILGYDWLKKNVNKYPDLQISDSKRFVIKVSDKMEERTLTDYGVSIDSYITYKEKAKDCKGVDADGDGYADPYTKAKQLFAMIDAMPISNEAKDGLALVSNAMSTIKKYAPWR